MTRTKKAARRKQGKAAKEKGVSDSSAGKAGKHARKAGPKAVAAANKPKNRDSNAKKPEESTNQAAAIDVASVTEPVEELSIHAALSEGIPSVAR